MVAADTTIKRPFQTIFELAGELHFDNRRFNQHLRGGNVQLAQGGFNLAVVLARGADEQGVVVFVGDDAHL